jgi:hypothetical protein
VFYSLWIISEDSRYLMPVLPMIPIVLAWSIETLGSRILSGLMCLGLAVNAAVVNVAPFGPDPYRLREYPWMIALQRDRNDKALLERIVNVTCRPENADHHNVIAVEYPYVNFNSADFYSLKERLTSGYRCHYHAVVSGVNELKNAIERVKSISPDYVVTVVPEKQFKPDFLNLVSREFAEYIAGSPEYALVERMNDYVLIFRRNAVNRPN